MPLLGSEEHYVPHNVLREPPALNIWGRRHEECTNTFILYIRGSSPYVSTTTTSVDRKSIAVGVSKLILT
jgi:hypothetical protein